jgi:rhodanese-related sulfurtransferase
VRAVSGSVELDAETAAEMIADGAQLVDVRKADELTEDGHIEGSLHIELAEVAAKAESLDRDRPLIFVCHSGARSGMAAEAFRQAGWDAYNLAGGVLAWERQGLPLTR